MGVFILADGLDPHLVCASLLEPGQRHQLQVIEFGTIGGRQAGKKTGNAAQYPEETMFNDRDGIHQILQFVERFQALCAIFRSQ